MEKAHQNEDVGKDDVLLSKESSKGSMIRRKTILDLIRSNPSITIPEIAIIQKVSARTIERDFDWLKDRGIIVREGSRSDGRWIVTENKMIDCMKVSVENDDCVNAMEMEWFKNLECEDTPGKNMRFYRKLSGMTQPELSEKLGVAKQFVSDMENGRKPISKVTAKKLAKIFDVPLAMFI